MPVPNYAQFVEVDVLPPAEGNWPGRTIMLVAGDTRMPYIWRKGSGAWAWAQLTGSQPPATHAGLPDVTSDQHHARLHAAAHASGQGDAITPAAIGASPGTHRHIDSAVLWGAVNMNLVGDTAVAIPFARWRPLELTAYSPSVDLSTVARFGLYTAPAGGGTALVVPVLLSLPLDGDDVFTIAAAPKRTVQTAASLYLRCTTPKGAPATCRFALTVRDLSA